MQYNEFIAALQSGITAVAAAPPSEPAPVAPLPSDAGGPSSSAQEAHPADEDATIGHRCPSMDMECMLAPADPGVGTPADVEDVGAVEDADDFVFVRTAVVA